MPTINYFCWVLLKKVPMSEGKAKCTLCSSLHEWAKCIKHLFFVWIFCCHQSWFICSKKVAHAWALSSIESELHIGELAQRIPVSLAHTMSEWFNQSSQQWPTAKEKKAWNWSCSIFDSKCTARLWNINSRVRTESRISSHSHTHTHRTI